MTSKRIFAGLLTGALCLSVLTACSGNDSSESSKEESSVKTQESRSGSDDKSDNSKTEESKSEDIKKKSPPADGMCTLYIRDALKNEKMTATFFNTMSGAKTDVEMEKTGEGDDYYAYTCKADTNLYNMVHVTYGNNVVSKDVAFNSYTAGWYLNKNDQIAYDPLLPYAEGMDLKYDPKYETKTFQFDGYEKNVYIWTPDDYDPESEEKYDTIYLLDGQSVLTTGRDRDMDNDTESWNVSESVTGMMSVTDNKAIVVCIATPQATRGDELIPNIGKIEEDPNADERHKAKTKQYGNLFADFVCDTVMPYIQENYNVYTEASHNALAGSSLGGLETFYAVLTHPDKFATGGVMSATFGTFEDDVWRNFLSDKVNLENAPFLYIYAGRFGFDNGDVTEEMYNRLIEMGYPKENLLYEKYEEGMHYMVYWRNIFSEFLQAMYLQKVEALECGVPVEYKDRTPNPFAGIPQDVPIAPNDPALKDKNNFVYYDNSETKWEHVYAYWWSSGTPVLNKISGALYIVDWPGVEMEKIEGTEIYKVIAPEGATNIIFDSGVTDAEVAQGKEAFQTTDLPFILEENAGQIYKIDLSVSPKQGRKSEATKYRYPGGSWSDYNG